MRRVLIGLDGVPYRLIEKFTGNGTMPHLGDVIKEGVFHPMASSIPEVSSVAWSSIITGANPGQHGIYGFTELAPASYRLRFPNFNDLKVPPFWLDNCKTRSVIINVPSTYPAREINGVLISGFVALDLNKAIFPPSTVSKLEGLGYRIDVDTEKAHKSMDLFVRDLGETLTSRVKVYRHLWDEEEWENFVLVFTGTDRLGHFLWNAYDQPNHPYHDAFLDHFRQIDAVIGEISGRLNADDGLFILSDHGFESVRKNVYVNRFLVDQGFFTLSTDPAKSLNDIDEGARAFALDPARIYVHTAGRYPRGRVKKDDRKSVIDDLIQAIECWSIDGEKVIDRIYHRDEIYHGPYIEKAPDLVLLSKSGFDLHASLKASHVTAETVFKGKHTHHDAFFVAKTANMPKIPENLSVSDVAGIFRALSV
jgi:predicted AlkP superfamily phosphohydrolase/phosphomutase